VNSGAIWPPGRIAAAKSIDYGHKSLEHDAFRYVGVAA
jgi:hypothetical protein